ncbi:hypothetical protein GCM10010168_42650 [Actinoplanes ianthinogenes]|uniref:Uncharacterized protein n=1 Tax=Actinoplanes ianthinogenes TaxID=122358 RepID=A0ABM7LVS7_9ACTN|nr:hypothetical protein [Actinoplanes ianthinogenes]BCJ43425.1 hypothetical protein Aiant_40820 [Actinoplanes ianthinogenes]GGR20203.1 hypothetical protein GCM10010168_42650 [Actinoplanes ianthinogenes]
MGTWLATVRFPDGVARYAVYSTVVEAMYADLYPTFHVEHYRERVSGDPLPSFPDRDLAPLDELIPVVITRAPDDREWHAVYCPRRSMVVGPHSPHHQWHVQESHDLVFGAHDNVRHLSQVNTRGRCGAPVTDAPLRYHREAPGIGNPEWREEDQPPAVDIFAEWTRPDMCRACLITALQAA